MAILNNFGAEIGSLISDPPEDIDSVVTCTLEDVSQLGSNTGTYYVTEILSSVKVRRGTPSPSSVLPFIEHRGFCTKFMILGLTSQQPRSTPNATEDGATGH